MINFNMMKSFDVLKSPTNNLGKDNKTNNIDKFEDIISKESSKKKNKGFLDIRKGFESTNSKIDIKDVLKKEKLQNIFDDLEKNLDEYPEKDIANLLGLGIFMFMLSKKEEVLNCLDVNLENTDNLNELISTIELSTLELKDTAPPIEQLIEKFIVNEKTLEIPILKEDLSVSKEVKVDNTTFVNLEDINIDSNSTSKSNLLDDIDLNSINNSEVEKAIKENWGDVGSQVLNDVEKMSNILRIVEKNILGDDIKKDLKSNIFDVSENSPNIDSFTEDLDIESIKYRKIDSKDIKNDIREFNNFLLGHRVRVSENKIEDKDLDALIKIMNANSKSEVSEMLNPHIYSSNISVDDKIKPSITPLEVRQAFLPQDVSTNIKHMMVNDLKELVLKVKPKELGEISIHLMKEGEVSDVVIIVEREEIFNSTKRSLAEINAQLKDAGLKINNISIQMKSNDNNPNFNFMSNTNSNDFKNQKNHSNKSNKHKGNGLSEEDNVEISSLDVSKNDVENEINLLA